MGAGGIKEIAWIVAAAIGPLAVYAGYEIAGYDFARAVGFSWAIGCMAAIIRAIVSEHGI